MQLQTEDDRVFPAELGFRSGPRGTQTSRTIMLAELGQLLEALPDDATKADYLRAVTEANALGKQTAANRRLTGQRLAELYGLDEGVVLFSALRDLWGVDPAGRPLLACLCANARDPLLRTTSAAVVSVGEGAVVGKHDFSLQVDQAWPGRFGAGTLDKIGRNAASSWTQSGHLAGRSRKVRTRVRPTAGVVAYALFLGHLQGLRGAMLLQTYWMSLLDCGTSLADTLASEASRRGWLEYRRVGDVVQVSFRWLLQGRGNSRL